MIFIIQQILKIKDVPINLILKKVILFEVDKKMKPNLENMLTD